LRDKALELLGPVVSALGYELWELEFAPGRSAVLRLYIDAAEGIDVNDCEKVSRAVSAVLDETDPIPGEYVLEVSSPGLDRVLRTAEHFQRFVGASVKLETLQPVAGRRKFTGQLLEATSQDIGLQVEGDTVRVPLAGIRRARLVPVLD
jgi:ribosome maturation factor RimP